MKPASASAGRASFGSELIPRIVAGVVMMAAALGATVVGGFPFLAFWLVASILVCWEWQRLIGGDRLWERVGAGSLALVVAAPFALHASGRWALLAIVLGAAATGALADRARKIAAGAGIFYAGAPLVGALLLRGSPLFGVAAIFWLFAVVWGTDVTAYFGGRMIGGPRLWPAVSPGKTWSGAVVGAVCAAVLGAIVAILLAPGARLGPMLALGLLVSAVSQLGDLFESFLKRRAGVKDSSHLIPGHGGLMDRLDGFIAATALAAALAAARSSGVWIASGLFQW